MEYLVPIIVAIIGLLGGVYGNKLSHREKRTENSNNQINKVIDSYQAMYGNIKSENENYRRQLQELKEENERERQRLIAKIRVKEEEMRKLRQQITALKKRLERK